MTEHPAVVFLRQALDRAEELARRAQGTWAGQADGWRINIVDDRGRRVAYLPNRLTAEDPEGDYATATLIEDNDPVAVLRRVAADRQILAEHQPKSYEPGCCAVCVTDRLLALEYWEPDEWPCRTVRLLAEAWGWAEEQHG